MWLDGVLGRVHAFDARRAAAWLAAYRAGHVATPGAAPLPGLGPRREATRLGDPLGQRLDRGDVLRIVNGVAVIGIEGVLVQDGKWVGEACGETSYEGLTTQILAARLDGAVRAVVFEVNSPGGMVDGLPEVAEELHRLSADKPTFAIVTGHMLSAAYWLGSACRVVIATETAMVGSIGTIAAHQDISGALEKAGVAITLIHSGARKTDGHPYAPLPADVLEDFQAEMDSLRDLFAAAVGRHRGARFSKDAALATEARAYRAKEALGLGLIDAVGNVNDAFAAVVAEYGA